MQTILTTCVLATFIATGESLSCMSCWNFGYTCERPLEDCPSDKDTCGITQMKKGFETEVIEKACFHSSDCNKPLSSFEFGTRGRLLTRTTCCTGKECEEVIPPLPPINTTPSGKKCPACYSEHNLDCKGVVAECTGDNFYCTAFRATGTFGNWTLPFSLKGCTNRDVCKDARLGSPSEFFTIDHCVTSPAIPGSGPRVAISGSLLFFLQTVSGLFLLEILV